MKLLIIPKQPLLPSSYSNISSCPQLSSTFFLLFWLSRSQIKIFTLHLVVILLIF